MMRLNRVVVAHLFFDARFSAEQLPTRINQIFSLSRTEAPGARVDMVLGGRSALRVGFDESALRADGDPKND